MPSGRLPLLVLATLALAIAAQASAGTRQDPPSARGSALDAAIASKVRQLVVLKRDLQRFGCDAPTDAVAAEGCRQLAAQADLLETEVDELKQRTGGAWTHAKQRAAEASAFQTAAPRLKPYTYRASTDPALRYRTLCVRLCDGFYFPIGGASLPGSFLDEEKLCHARCAVPAALFYQPAPGGDAEGLVALTGERYADLPNAFRYQNEYIEHCTCQPRPWSIQARAAYDRRAVLATRSRAGRIVAAGAGGMARLLAEADQPMAQAAPPPRLARASARIEPYPERRGLFWRFRTGRAGAGQRGPRPQSASQQRRPLLFRGR